MNQDINQIVQQVLQKILVEDPYYFLPKQFHVLSWKSKKIEGALITKINGQRYLGLPKKDKTGQSYWCYKLLTEPVVSKSQEIPPQPNSESVPLEQNPNSLEESEVVKKFREKYGTASEPKRA